jgi:hypothetical protein
MTFSVARDKRSGRDYWEAIARALGVVASLLIGAAAITVLQADPSLDADAVPPGYGVPSKYFLALELLGAAAIGGIGVLRGSRPLLGAAGGLILPIGLMSLLVVPAVLLIGACGVIPARRRTSGHELAAGLLIVLLGLASFFVPAIMSSARCWVEIQDSAGVRYEFTEGMVGGVPGQRSATCAERIPDPASFPIAVAIETGALALALASSATATRRRPID